MDQLICSRRAALGLVGGAVGGMVGLTTLSGCLFRSEPSSGPGFAYLLPNKYLTWLTDLKWYPLLEERTGIPVKLVDGGPSEQYYQKFDLALASHGIKDAAIANQAQVEVYGEQGAFMDLAPLIRQHAPHVQAYLDANADYRALVRATNGRIYGIMTERPRITPVTFYRADMFEAAGITSVPRDIAELTTVLTKLKSTYSSKRDFFPYSGRDSFVGLQYAFDANDTIDSAGKIHGIYASGQGNDIFSPGFKELIAWYQGLYRDELIDPEFVRGSATEESWQTKMINGKGAVCTDFFTRPSWFIQNGGPDIDPNYSMAVMPAFLGPDGRERKVTMGERYNPSEMFVILKSSDRAEKIMKFLDYVYSPAGRTLMNYGVKGESYDVVDGKKVYTASYEKALAVKPGQANWSFFQDRLTFPAPVDNKAFYNWGDKLTRSFAADYFGRYAKIYPGLRYTADQIEARTGLLAEVEPFILAETVKFATGERSMSGWDDFLAEAKDKGAQEITAIDQAAYDAMSGIER